MGLDPNSVKFLLYSKFLGADFSTTAMMGRQGLHLSPASLSECLGCFNCAIDDATLARVFRNHDGYAEGLLQHLGAVRVDSFDYSPHERPTHLHDMNQPIRDEFKGRYTSLIDGGSLEHVFNFLIAIKNCMEMIAVGGHFLSITPVNNFFGHGFYQFSAEAYFRVFSRPNGFETRAAVLFEDVGTRWYRIQDPELLGRRVTLMNYRPTSMAVLAQKVAEHPVFALMPQQSDYVRTWAHGKALHCNSDLPIRSLGLKSLVQKCLPAFLKRALKKAVFSVFGIYVIEDFPDFFLPVDVCFPRQKEVNSLQPHDR
jgi:hypothetical protein